MILDWDFTEFIEEFRKTVSLQYLFFSFLNMVYQSIYYIFIMSFSNIYVFLLKILHWGFVNSFLNLHFLLVTAV